MVDSDKGRTTHKIVLGDEAYYLKCVDKPTPASALEALLTLRRPHHYCWREMQQVMSLQKENVAVMDVAAAGESLSWGIPKFSFILVKEVPGESLDGVFEASPPQGRLALLEQLGKLQESRDFLYKKETSDDQSVAVGKLRACLDSALRVAPKAIIAVLFICVVYYSYKVSLVSLITP